jgi:hypothetical protein
VLKEANVLKEIRMLFKKGQNIKEHTTNFPKEDSLVRLTLFKFDNVERVENVIN